MGGHGPHIEGNQNNIQEEDANLSQRIRSIEFIKHNPQLFYLDFFNPQNHYEVAGGWKTLALSALGAWISFGYFTRAAAQRPYNFYYNLHQGFLRAVFGGILGAGFGYVKFGDRQRLHNAWVAERLRRRYPEAQTLGANNLW